MATNQGPSGWRFAFLAALAGSCFVGCGGNAKTGGTGNYAGSNSDGGREAPGLPSEPTGAAGSDPLPEPRGHGWSVRDATPYSRTEHATILDQERDRMIVIGGAGGLDAWALPLSGQNQNQWTQLLPEGDSPPVDDSNRGWAVSAVYDPFGQRVLVLRADSSQFKTPRIWELTLADSPAWHELTLEGPSPGAELDQGKMVLDRSHRRVLIVGGGQNSSGTWALSLDAPARWSRLADAPAADPSTGSPFVLGINTGALFIDAPRETVVLIVGELGPSQVWTLPLAGGDWTLGSSGSCGADYRTSSIYDSAHDRVIFLGLSCGLSSYELATGKWQTLDMDYLNHQIDSSLASAISTIDDPQRGRALFFSGGLAAGNATTELRYDDLRLSVVVPNTLGSSAGGTTGVWDAQREALVAFGADAGVTRSHGAGAKDIWRDVAGPQPEFSKGVYDPVGHAVIAIGHPQFGATTELVARLPSKPGSAWQDIPVSGGPRVRNRPTAVYDSVEQRVILHGGEAATDSTPGELLNDTWALSLTGEPQWTELATSGDSGGARAQQVAIFDPIGQRMISYGSPADSSPIHASGDLHQLMLDDSLTWSAMHAAGTGPSHGEVLALYDPEGERMLILDETHLFALTLRGELRWHRFCEPGMTMPGSRPYFVDPSYYQSSTLLGLAPDGLFAAKGDGAFRFDLETSYCD